MSHPYEEPIQMVIHLVRMLKEEVKLQLAPIPDIQVGVLAPLTMIDNRLTHLIGHTPAAEEGPSRKFGPIKVEKKVTPPPAETSETAAPFEELPAAVPLAAQTAQEAFANNLREEREKIYGGFADRSPEELLDTVEDPLVRAVAKKAGVKVSENNPERITLDFIKKIQKKMITDRELAQRIAAGQEQINED